MKASAFIVFVALLGSIRLASAAGIDQIDCGRWQITGKLKSFSNGEVALRLHADTKREYPIFIESIGGEEVLQYDGVGLEAEIEVFSVPPKAVYRAKWVRALGNVSASRKPSKIKKLKSQSCKKE